MLVAKKLSNGTASCPYLLKKPACAMSTNVLSAKRYAAAKSISYPLTFFILSFTYVLVLFLFREESFGAVDIAATIVWLLASAYYFWKWKNTYYELKGDQLYYCSGFTKGHISVPSIQKIHTHSRAWGNLIAALTFRGLMITYNKWDEIFIAPKNEEAFLKELLQINPEIKVLNEKNA